MGFSCVVWFLYGCVFPVDDKLYLKRDGAYNNKVNPKVCEVGVTFNCKITIVKLETMWHSDFYCCLTQLFLHHNVWTPACDNTELPQQNNGKVGELIRPFQY